MVWRSSRKSGSGRETLSEVWNWLGDPLGGVVVVWTPYRRYGGGRETLPEVRKWSGAPPRGP